MSFSAGLELFLLLGVAQGLFLALLLLTRRDNAAANRILAAAMIAFSLFLAEVVLYAGGYFRNLPHLIGLSEPVVFLFGPIIYLYVCRISGNVLAGKRVLLHFLPAIATIVYLVPFFLKSGPDKIALVESVMENGPPLYLKALAWLNHPHGAVYTIVTFGVVGRYQRRLKDNFSTLDRINLGWLRKVLIGVMVAWSVAIVSFGLELLGVDDLGADPSPVSLVLVVFVYVIGILGLRQPEVFWPSTPVGAQEQNPAVAPEPGAGKYKKSGLDAQKAAVLEQDLLAMMKENQPQEDAGLTLQQLADRLGVSLHHLSEVINTRLDSNFHNFVNGYRVDEAKRRLIDPALSHQTILAIALESGFRSKSTFNKIFKQFTGTTPSSFKRDNSLT